MVNVVAIFVALFVLAVGFVSLTEIQEIAPLFGAFLAEPPMLKAAWAVLVLAPLGALILAGWLSFTLIRQRRSTAALEQRLSGVRQEISKAENSQVDAEASVHHLVRTDPEDSIGALQQRLTEAERFFRVQQNRNEMGNLQSRVDDIRLQQQALRERLAPVLDKRRAIEQLFMALDTQQNDIDRSLAEIATGDDAIALDTRLNDLMEFVRRSHARCDGIEHASKTIANLKEDIRGLQDRLGPFAAADGGMTSRVRELKDAGGKLETAIKSLEQTPEGALGERVQKLADDKKRLDDGLSHLTTEYLKLATLRKDVDGLFASFARTLDMVSNGSGANGPVSGANGPVDVDARVEELWDFIGQTQVHLDDVERRMVIFGQLQMRLGGLQSRLAPLEDKDSGVANLIDQLRDSRDMLVAKIRRIEQDDDGSLAERVRKFTETKHELEERLTVLADQFSKLATIRKDIAGLFEKLSGAISTSSN